MHATRAAASPASPAAPAAATGRATAPPPANRSVALPDLSRAVPDPRTILLAMLLINGAVLAQAAFPGVICGAVVVTVLLATSGLRSAVRHACTFAVTFTAFAAMYLWLPHALPSTATAVLAALGFWCARFSIAIGVSAYAIGVIRPTELTAALRAVRTPQFLVIPLAVALRIIPVIVTEARAIGEAMTLRGLRPGARSFLLHPVRSGEMLLIPLLSTVVRVGDELAASALIRGLGLRTRQTTIAELRFRVSDALLLAATAAVLFASFGPVGALTGSGGA